MIERIIPTSMTGTVNETYEEGLNTIVDYISNIKGTYAIVDPHNFGLYYGNIITKYMGFQTFWTTLVEIFASNSKVMFDCNNEPYDMGSASVPDLMQACINGVRAAGATI